MAKKFKKNKVNKKQDSRVNINIKETLKHLHLMTSSAYIFEIGSMIYVTQGR